MCWGGGCFSRRTSARNTEKSENRERWENPLPKQQSRRQIACKSYTHKGKTKAHGLLWTALSSSFGGSVLPLITDVWERAAATGLIPPYSPKRAMTFVGKIKANAPIWVVIDSIKFFHRRHIFYQWRSVRQMEWGNEMKASTGKEKMRSLSLFSPPSFLISRSVLLLGWLCKTKKTIRNTQSKQQQKNTNQHTCSSGLFLSFPLFRLQSFLCMYRYF